MATTFKDVKRSCARGLGGGRQADALPMEQWHRMADYRGVAVTDAADVMLVGAWWMLREIEVANLRQQDVSATRSGGCGVAELRVSASKTDTAGRGVKRQHGCACPSPLCPVAAVKRLLARAAGTEGAYLVQATNGGVVTKIQMVAEIQAVAKALGASTGNFSGHTLRVTSAQLMALAGVSEEKIKMFGRWASAAMLAYVRETLLTKSGLKVAKEVSQATLQEQAQAARADDGSSSTGTTAKWKRFTGGQGSRVG